MAKPCTYLQWSKIKSCLCKLIERSMPWNKWWSTHNIIWNRVPDRRSKRKWAITKCCLTVCRSIEKRHGVWAGVWWLYLQEICDIWWCSTAVALATQASYFVSASYFDRKPVKWSNDIFVLKERSSVHVLEKTGVWVLDCGQYIYRVTIIRKMVYSQMWR